MAALKTSKIISINDINRVEIEQLIDRANQLREERFRRYLPPFIMGLFFFQESTRTQIGFQAAAYRLGGQVFTFKNTKYQSNMSSAESLADSIKVLESYADVLCIRHFDDSIFSDLFRSISKPVVNCGNGFDEHPTQTLTDLYMIKDTLGNIDNLTIALVGDLRHMRTSHSLLLGLSKFNRISVICVSPKELRMPDRYKNVYGKTPNNLKEINDLNLQGVDVVYMAGFAPKTPIGDYDADIREKYSLRGKSFLSLVKPPIIMCPLPRVDEIDPTLDQTPYSKYFKQSALGLYTRMALLEFILAPKGENIYNVGGLN